MLKLSNVVFGEKAGDNMLNYHEVETLLLKIQAGTVATDKEIVDLKEVVDHGAYGDKLKMYIALMIKLNEGNKIMASKKTA